MRSRLALVAAAAAAMLVPLAQADDGVRYPERFRTFAHVATGIVTPGFVFNGVDLGALVPGLHNIYANAPAWRGYLAVAGAAPAPAVFADGSVIAFDLWEPGALQSGSGSFTFQKQRLAVAVMQKNAQKYAATGGWGFQVFVNEQPVLDAAAQQQCFACHQITPNSDFVFSRIAN